MTMNVDAHYPTVSIAIPVFNEEENIVRCLQSIYDQDYPRENIEVFIIDDDSRDATVKRARTFPVTILRNGSHDAERGKMIAFERAHGDFFLYLDADITLCGKDWLTKMVTPLLEDMNLTGSFTRFVPEKTANALERYYSWNPLQLDSIFEFFSTSLSKTIIDHRPAYAICQFFPFKVPPVGICVHRRELIAPLLKSEKKFLELDVMVKLVYRQHTKFAYVPSAGLVHRSFSTIGELVHKRIRNVKKVYLADIARREYTWFNLKYRRDVLKVVVWMLYANSLIGPLLRGFGRSVMHRDHAGLWEGILTPVLTDAIIVSFLTDRRGWKLIVRALQ